MLQKRKINNHVIAKIHKYKANKLSDHNSVWRQVKGAEGAIGAARIFMVKRNEMKRRQENMLKLLRRDAYALWGLEDDDLFE